MAFNNIIPAWALMPVRVVGEYSNGHKIQEGFRSKTEAMTWLHNEGDHVAEYHLLID